jgi:hypothetical protein
MVTAWEQPVAASPSVQLWIPERESGGPIVEGIFDQTVSGRAAIFSGAAPSALSPSWQQRLADQAARVGRLFQELGYFGRCSFDAILVGKEKGGAEIHWVQCNGRWGGVSIPMTVANRLVGDWTRRPPVIIERRELHGSRRDLQAILDELADELYMPDTHPTGAVILYPGRLEEGTGFGVMVLGETLEAARAQADSVAAKLVPPPDRP